MDFFSQAVEKIIQEQEAIIGPIALEEAQKVEGLKVDMAKQEVAFSGDKTEILEKLVERYQRLFGRASVEVCRDAVREIMPQLPPQQVPALLK